MVENIYFVPKRQWRKWSDTEQRLFNGMYQTMLDQQLFKHPLGATQSDECWKTTAWNAAWMAADLLKAERKYGR
jgi:hypothetical protein